MRAALCWALLRLTSAGGGQCTRAKADSVLPALRRAPRFSFVPGLAGFCPPRREAAPSAIPPQAQAQFQCGAAAFSAAI
jgi:hypothetical protein